tara:strand:- start:6878 stop:7117 length:240 start_codon:yes stop_codon:yes gene_type:complete
MTNDNSYKTKLLQALYHKKISKRNAALAEISFILENPVEEPLEKLEKQIDTLTFCDLSIGQIEMMYGPGDEADNEQPKD